MALPTWACGLFDLLGPVAGFQLGEIGPGRGQVRPGPVHFVFQVLGLQTGRLLAAM